MKQFKKILGSDKMNREEVARKVNIIRILKTMLIAFILFWLTLLSSCDVFVRVPVDDGHRHWEHHDHDDHHDHDEADDDGGNG